MKVTSSPPKRGCSDRLAQVGNAVPVLEGFYPVTVGQIAAGTVHRRHSSWYATMPGHPVQRTAGPHQAAAVLVALVDQGKRPTLPAQAPGTCAPSTVRIIGWSGVRVTRQDALHDLAHPRAAHRPPATAAVHRRGRGVALRAAQQRPRAALLGLPAVDGTGPRPALHRHLPDDRGGRHGSAGGVDRVSDGAFIGWCGLTSWNPDFRSASLGYVFDAAAWGRGYATETAHAVLRWAFDTLDLNRVQAEADTRNVASARVLEKLGFVREGTLREDCVVNGDVSDSWVFGLLRREWHPHSTHGRGPDAEYRGELPLVSFVR